MPTDDAADLGHLFVPPKRLDVGIGVVGAGFIVRDCHLVAYAEAGFRVVGLTSRTLATARRGRPAPRRPPRLRHARADARRPGDRGGRHRRPPAEQPGVIRRILAHPRKVRGILAQKPLALSYAEAHALVEACERGRGRSCRSTRTCGTTSRCGPSRRCSTAARWASRCWRRSRCGPSRTGCPGPRGGRSLSTFIMSIHHLDTFRYWLGDPDRVLASTRPDPRTKFAHDDGINLYILEYDDGARASRLGRRLGRPGPRGGRRPTSASAGASRGPTAWPSARSAGPAGPPGSPARSTTRPSRDDGTWHRPRWPEAWFPDAFAGTMAGLLRALEDGHRARHLRPRQPQDDRPVRGRPRGRPRAPGGSRPHRPSNRSSRNHAMKLGLINSAWAQAGRETAFGIRHDEGDRLRHDRHLRRPARHRRQGAEAHQGRVRPGRAADRQRRLRRRRPDRLQPERAAVPRRAGARRTSTWLRVRGEERAAGARRVHLGAAGDPAGRAVGDGRGQRAGRSASTPRTSGWRSPWSWSRSSCRC